MKTRSKQHARRNGLGNALEGIGLFFRTQLNAWIHLGAGAAAVAAGFFFHISGNEWLALCGAIALVLVAEGLNTAIEFLGDAVSEDYNESIRAAKDIGAGAVLLAAAAAVITGLLIFLPRLLP